MKLILISKSIACGLAIYFIAIAMCLYADQPKQLDPDKIYVGSTSCNATINSSLNIPASDTCIYMKWELLIYNDKNKAGSFRLNISYGDYLPNTMYFLGGGKSMSITGKLVTDYVTKAKSKYKLYRLIGDKKQPILLLLALDNNILHFVNRDMKFVKGDASFGFVLNRLNSSK